MKSLNGAKLLYLDLFFELPENFEGDLTDAIQALVDYRRNEEKQHTCEPVDLTQTGDEWLDFLNARLHGFRIVGQAGMAKYNEELEDWEDIEDGSGEVVDETASE